MEKLIDGKFTYLFANDKEDAKLLREIGTQLGAVESEYDNGRPITLFPSHGSKELGTFEPLPCLITPNDTKEIFEIRDKARQI